MPVGVLAGALCFCSGIFFGLLAAKDFSEGNAAWRKHLLWRLKAYCLGDGYSVLPFFGFSKILFHQTRLAAN
jgi:hypothetical protein